jgi:vitamin B12/bleomycin/antimicrobial peptide transport system ATP-binding/permease protein
MPFISNRLWARLGGIGLPFFRSEQRYRAWFALFVLVVLLLTVNALNVVNSYVGNDVMTALERREEWRFYVMAGVLVGVFLASTVVEVYARYVELHLGLLWRDWLTRRFLDRYLADRAYRRLAELGHIDNPDQRISEDVRTFTATSLSFVILLFNAVVTFVAFASVLWTITPWLFLVAVVYAVTGTVGTILLGRRLVPLDNLQLKKEADFRFALGRVREHGGAVAQLGGERDEKARLGGRLQSVVDNYYAIINVTRNLLFFTTTYDYLPQIIPALLAAPLYIRGDVPFGTVTQAAMAFSQLLGAFSLIVRKFQDVSSYAAVAGRLGSMWEAIGPIPPDEAAPAAPPPAPAGPAVEVVPNGRHVTFDKVTLRTPKQGRPLVRDLTLHEPEGKRLLVTGPCGAGKTALLLAAAGLWHEGEGRIVRPGDVMFIPQHPYMASGRLRDVLLYGIDHNGKSDERLMEVLREVGLEEVVAREGGLDAEREWGEVLSWGEQRAVAFAHVLLAEPRFAFLDDTAEPLEPERMKRLYEALARSSITYVSVGSHPALNPFHERRLELYGDGTWRVVPSEAVSEN